MACLGLRLALQLELVLGVRLELVLRLGLGLCFRVTVSNHVGDLQSDLPFDSGITW